MHRPVKTHTSNIAAEMFDLYLERGSMNREELHRAGYDDEQIDANWQAVAARILAAETSSRAA